MRTDRVPGLTLQAVLGSVDCPLVISPIAGDTAGRHQVPPHVGEAGPGAGVVATAGGGQAGQSVALRESEVTPGPDDHPLVSLPDEVSPLGVAEHLPDGHTVLVAQRQPDSLAVLDAAVREGVVAEHRLGRRPAGLRQVVDQLLLDGGGDLLVPPTSSVVLADIEPDQTPAHDVVPADGSVVRSTVTSHHAALLSALLPPSDVHHEASLVLGGLAGQLVHSLTGVVTTVLCCDPQN